MGWRCAPALGTTLLEERVYPFRQLVDARRELLHVGGRVDAEPAQRALDALLENLLELVPGAAGDRVHLVRRGLGRAARGLGGVRRRVACPRLETFALLHQRLEDLCAALLRLGERAEAREPDLPRRIEDRLREPLGWIGLPRAQLGLCFLEHRLLLRGRIEASTRESMRFV